MAPSSMQFTRSTSISHHLSTFTVVAQRARTRRNSETCVSFLVAFFSLVVFQKKNQKNKNEKTKKNKDQLKPAHHGLRASHKESDVVVKYANREFLVFFVKYHTSTDDKSDDETRGRLNKMKKREIEGDAQPLWGVRRSPLVWKGCRASSASRRARVYQQKTSRSWEYGNFSATKTTATLWVRGVERLVFFVLLK